MFKDRLNKVIESKGVSKYQIAKETKISEATLSNYCNGKVSPSPSIVMQLAQYFEVDFNWLLNGAYPNSDGDIVFADPRSEYVILGNKKFNSKDSSAVITHLEKEINFRDRIITEKEQTINRLTNILEEKIDTIIKQTKK